MIVEVCANSLQSALNLKLQEQTELNCALNLPLGGLHPTMDSLKK